MDSMEEFIESVPGGYKELMEVTGSPYASVTKWKRRGAGPEYWDALVDRYNVSHAELHSWSQKCKKTYPN